MLTVLHPDILRAIIEFPMGLLPARHTETGKLLLIIKIHKECILAARLKGGFNFYLAPLQSSSGLTVALVTAFFDDRDEPLIIQTPLFDEPLGNDMLELLTYDNIDVYFFDEHGREWMGHRTSKHDSGSLIALGKSFGLLTYHPDTLISIYDNLELWFGFRTAQDDANSIEVRFVKELFPSDISILDIRQDGHDYFGSSGFSNFSLEREKPGYFQERDIVACLKRAFRGDQLAINPMRRDDRREFVDVLAVNHTHLLLVQAKDSPNTNASLSRTIDRKRRTSQSQIEKAVKQDNGAASYVRGNNQLHLIIDSKHFDVDLAGKTLVTLVIVQEMFADAGNTFVLRYREMEREGEVFVLLDYSAFNFFCHEFRSEKLLLTAFADYSAKILASGVWLDPLTYVLKFRQERLNNLGR